MTRSILHIRPATIASASQPWPLHYRIAMTRDGYGLAEVLGLKLSQLGYNVCIDVELPEQCDVAILLDALQTFSDEAQAIAVNERLFAHAKKIAPHFSVHGGVLIGVQNLAGQFGLAATEPFAVWAGGLSGLVKTAVQEWPAATCRVIDIEYIIPIEHIVPAEMPGSSLQGCESFPSLQTGSRHPCRDDRRLALPKMAERLLAEFFTVDPTIEIGLLANGQRITTALRTEAVDKKKKAFSDHAVVLVTGGGRGVTAACLLALAKTQPLRFVLFGRTALQKEPEIYRQASTTPELKKVIFEQLVAKQLPATPKAIQAEVNRIEANREIEATINSLQQLDSAVIYKAVDVQNEEALQTAVSEVRTQWGNIAGIIHGAGVLADKLIQEKTPEQFTQVFSTKVIGLKNLLAVTQADSLQAVVLFSSVAGRFGNTGQCDYAMANEVLNKVAQEYQRQHPNCVVKAINWGPWQGGMVTPQLQQLFQQRGVALLPIAEGAQRLVDEIQAGPSTVEVVIGETLQPELATAEPSLTVDQLTYPFLVDHVVQEVPVLPVCLVMEWFVAAAKKQNPQAKSFVVENFRMMRGVQLKEFYRAPQTFVLSCEPKETHWRLTLRSDAQSLSLNYAADIHLLDAPAEPPVLQLPDLSSAAAWPYDLEEVYDDAYHQRLLFHGPHFQAIHRLDGIGDDVAIAHVFGVQAMHWPGHWHTDAVAIDAVFQIARLWGDRMLGKRSLPTAVGRLQLFDDRQSSGSLRCVLKGRVKSKFAIAVDAWLFHDDGRLYAELLEVEGVCYDI